MDKPASSKDEEFEEISSDLTNIYRYLFPYVFIIFFISIGIYEYITNNFFLYSVFLIFGLPFIFIAQSWNVFKLQKIYINKGKKELKLENGGIVKFDEVEKISKQFFSDTFIIIKINENGTIRKIYVALNSWNMLYKELKELIIKD